MKFNYKKVSCINEIAVRKFLPKSLAKIIEIVRRDIVV